MSGDVLQGREAHDLMGLQGEILVRALALGAPQGLAAKIAAEALDAVATSPVASAAHRLTYQRLVAHQRAGGA